VLLQEQSLQVYKRQNDAKDTNKTTNILRFIWKEKSSPTLQFLGHQIVLLEKIILYCIITLSMYNRYFHDLV